MSTNFSPRRFLLNLHTHADTDGQVTYLPEDNQVECVRRVADKVISITSHLTTLDNVPSVYSDRMDTFEAILKMLNHMQFVVAKKLAFSVSAEAVDTMENKQLAVCMVLCHACLRYVQKALAFENVYTFPGGLRLETNVRSPLCGGALATVLDDIVPKIPTKADALWLVGSLRCLLDVAGAEGGYDGCATFAKRPSSSKLHPDVEGHGYAKMVLEACLTNAGKGSSDMELFEGYDWDSEVAVDGVRIGWGCVPSRARADIVMCV
jgi:hypothetical protein